MSQIPNITTKTGDTGTTSLFSQERVKKSHIAMICNSKMDSFDSALGLIRHSGIPKHLCDEVRKIQCRLIYLKGQLATFPTKWEEYEKSQPAINKSDVSQLEDSYSRLKLELEQQDYELTGWIIYGDEGRTSAQVDLAKNYCREAEVALYQLIESYENSQGTAPFKLNPYILQYMNRLSDWLFTLARATAK